MINGKYLESIRMRERGLEPLWFNPLDPKYGENEYVGS